MSNWAIASLALLPPLAIAVVAGLRGGSPDRLVALPLASGVATTLLVLVTFLFDQSSFVDIALCLSLLSLPSTLLLAIFFERWI